MSHDSETGIMHVVTSGTVTIPDLNRMSKDAAAAIEEHGTQLFLVDYRGVDSIELSTVDIYEQPQQMQRAGVPAGSRLAQVFREEHVETFRFFETVCWNRGYVVKLFSEPEPAQQWLLDGSRPGRVD